MFQVCRGPCFVLAGFVLLSASLLWHQASPGLPLRHRPSLEGVRVISSQCTDQLSKQEQGNTGFLGHGSDVTALSVPSWTEWRDAIPVVVVTNSLTLACFFFEGTVDLDAKERDENIAENL